MSQKIEKLCAKKTSKEIVGEIASLAAECVKGVENYNMLIELVCQLGLAAQEEALADAPDCDSCNRIDPDNPPERYNEGYE